MSMSCNQTSHQPIQVNTQNNKEYFTQRNLEIGHNVKENLLNAVSSDLNKEILILPMNKKIRHKFLLHYYFYYSDTQKNERNRFRLNQLIQFGRTNSNTASVSTY